MKLYNKGEWSITVIASTVLILVVLITLIVVFRGQLSGLVSGFSGISEQATKSASSLDLKNILPK